MSSPRPMQTEDPSAITPPLPAGPGEGGEGAVPENTTLASYVFQHYHRFLTDHERAVYRHLTALYKHRDHGPPAPGTAADTGSLRGAFRRWLSDDDDVIGDAQAGWEE